MVTIKFDLTLNGAAPAGDVMQLFFDPGNAGQTGFTLCGELGPACQGNGQVLHRMFGGFRAQASDASYRFERVDSANHVTVIRAGTVSMRQDASVVATYTYP